MLFLNLEIAALFRHLASWEFAEVRKGIGLALVLYQHEYHSNKRNF
jgi:hypothetical protein